MCLILFGHQVQSGCSLVLAANRDEFYDRPTREAAFWEADAEPGTLLAGKDLLAGGTWLGVTRSGRFAAVTNIRDPSQVERKPRSRGALTLDFLNSDVSAGDYCANLAAHFDEFAGYNLLVGDGHTLCYVNNLERQLQTLKPGIYGLSNGLLNCDWPKVAIGRTRLESLLRDGAAPDTDQLIALMNDRQPAPDDSLPDTGLPTELERALSSAFIQNQERGYGTLCSTGLIIGDRDIRFCEQNYDAAGNSATAHFFEFNLQRD